MSDRPGAGLTAGPTSARLCRETGGPKRPPGGKLPRVIMNQHLPKGVLGNSRDVKRKKKLQGFHGQRNLAKGLHEKLPKSFIF